MGEMNGFRSRRMSFVVCNKHFSNTVKHFKIFSYFFKSLLLTAIFTFVEHFALNLYDIAPSVPTHPDHLPAGP